MGDCFSLSPGFGLKTGISAGGVDEGQNGAAELFSLSHQPLGLAVTLGARHTEIAAQIFLPGVSFALADHSDRAAVEEGDAAQNRRIISEQPVAPLFKKVGEKRPDIILDPRAVRMTGEGNPLKRAALCHAVHLPFHVTATAG